MEKEELSAFINISFYRIKTEGKLFFELVFDFIKFRATYLFKFEKARVIKNSLALVLIFIIAFLVMYKPFSRVIQKTSLVYMEYEEKTKEEFLNNLGKLESGNNYKIVNPLGYMGRWQIGQSALVDIGMNVDKQVFLANPEIQDIAMDLLLKKNKQYLISYIGKFEGKTIKGIYITQSGLLAGAHLGGAESVKDFLDTKGENDFKDGNGIDRKSVV